MATQDLAKIERHSDLRSVWPNEATNFTPWLADNIDVLGDALGMELEIGTTEASVGDFSVDILTINNRDGQVVVIENQLQRTDHDHLGKLLTYMAGRDANVIVWIAERFRDEHRAALDALNARTGEDTQFFGVEVELWKIDSSRPAVNFKLVATPNDWRKQEISKAGTLSERDQRYRTFFQDLIDTLREQHSFTDAHKAQLQRWYYFPSGYGRRARYGASFYSGGARVEVYLDGDQESNKRLFDQLNEMAEAIEADIGSGLEWERLDSRKASRISLVRDGSIDDDDNTRAEIRQWMITNLLKFSDVFGPRLDDLIARI